MLIIIIIINNFMRIKFYAYYQNRLPYLRLYSYSPFSQPLLFFCTLVLDIASDILFPGVVMVPLAVEVLVV